MVDVSVILPVNNEAENLRQCHRELSDAVDHLEQSFEFIFIDDGSTDNSMEVLREICREDRRAIALRLGRNFGQTAAFSAGIRQAQGRVLVLMDADLQNDPRDIPHLLEELNKDCDLVSGWRRHRRDRAFSRVLPSRIANRLISAVSGVKLHDYGCSLKAYRADMLKGVRLYGEMHRFIPILLAGYGARIREIEVNHRPRISGRSSYGFARAYKVVVDLLLIRFLSSYETKPIHIFGGFALFNFVMALLAAALAVYFKVTGQKDFVETPLPLLVALTGLVGVVSIFMGFIAELLVRTYYESQAKEPYIIVESVNTEELP